MDGAFKKSKTPSLDRDDTVWIFDLDNTLYPETCNLFAGIDRNMGAYISKLLQVDLVEAKRLQKDYFLNYGTTLKGLIEVHGVEPMEFLDFVHDVDLSSVPEDPDLKTTLQSLKGRKYVFTNGSTSYAGRVLNKIGITHVIDDVFDIARSGFLPKPHVEPYRTLIRHYDIDPTRAVMIEDMARNLVPASELGMTTVWVKTESSFARIGHDPNHIHYEIDHLGTFLKACQGEHHA